MEEKEKKDKSKELSDVEKQYEIENNLLIEALRHSEILLYHIAEQGIDVDEKYVNALIEAKHLDIKKQWTKEKEIDFWMAYQKISKLIKPITIDSLLASKEKKVQKESWFKRTFSSKTISSSTVKAVRSFSIMALFSMLIMLVLQMYSIKGTKLLNTIQFNERRMKIIEDQIADLSLIDKSNNRRTSLQIGQIQSERDALELQTSSSISLLKNWLRYTNWIGFENPDEIYSENESASPDEFNPINTQINYVLNTQIMQEAKNLTTILNLYILPLLYGLLGGFVFVLRSLSIETRAMIYTKESNVTYTLRIVLGALAGLVVGLIWGDLEQHDLAFLESLSTLTIAFLAGYSVEFLFQLLDKLMFSINKNDEKKEAEPQTKEIVKKKE